MGHTWIFAALLTLKGAKIDGGSIATVKFNPYYLEIPVHVGYKYAVNENFALFGSVGPYLAVGLFRKDKLSIGNAIGDWADIEGMESVGGLEGKSVSEDIFGDDGFKRFDFGLGLKAGVEFNKKYQVALSYDFGLIDVQKDLGMKKQEPDDIIWVICSKNGLCNFVARINSLPLQQIKNE